jgi:RNA polymerase sigma factor (TIGR02999 family)
MAPAGEVTQLLRAWRNGQNSALDRLMPMIYGELRRMARHQMNKERAGITLQTTALIHEAYLRLVGANVSWQDRAHFSAIASQIMRRILVDAARARVSMKRGGHARREEHSAAVDLNQVPDLSAHRDRELVAIHEALEVLETVDSRKARVVELRFFAGLSVGETAAVLKIAPQTVMRDWKLAKAWLLSELGAPKPRSQHD